MGMALSSLLVRKEAGVAVVTINRPEKLNAMNPAVLGELEAAIRDAEGDAAVRVLVVTGAGEKAFVAGADIAAMREMGPREAKAFADLGQRVSMALENSRLVTIAAVNGYALGGGCELSMAFDLVIASENARFGQPEVTLGIPPGWLGTHRLPRLVGLRKGLELLLTGEQITAQQALELGLVNKVVAPGKALEAALEMAQKVLRNGPLAVEATKRLARVGSRLSTEQAAELEAAAFAIGFSTRDQREGMGAFLEKRKPNYTGS